MTVLARKYVQFNDLVIDNFDMLTSASLSGGFKTATAEFSFGHGSYVPFKAKQQLLKEQNLSMTIKLDTRKLSCEQRKFYKDFVAMNILKPGKIWAIEGEQLLWSNAYVSDFSEEYSTEKHFISIDIDLILQDGYWHKADERKVFFKPYDACNFADCLDFREAAPCIDDVNCCIGCPRPDVKECPKCICDCDWTTQENSLCSMKQEIVKSYYERCGDTYQIIYNCEAGKKIFGIEKMLGEKLCNADIGGLVAGQFYSDTVVDSDLVTITIVGEVTNPSITINGNTMQVNGSYDGRLIINAIGGISYQTDVDYPAVAVAYDKLVIPSGNTLGYLVHHGNNSAIVSGCAGTVCMYVNTDGLTI